MHELSLIQSLFDEIESIKKSNQLNKITDIYLSVGEMSGVDREFLRSTYELFIAETQWRDLRLHLQGVPWVICCDDCGLEQQVVNKHNRCSSCGSFSTTTLRGKEFILQKIEAETEAQAED